MHKIEELNAASFSSPASVEAYSHRYLRSSEASAITEYMRSGERVLDMGCGAGRTTAYIAENGAEVVGADFSAPLIAQAKKLYPQLDFRVMDARRVPFPDAYFDAVFFSFNGIDNLYPLESRTRAMRELVRVLKPGGFFIYSSHNALCIPRTRFGWKVLLMNFLRLRPGPHWREERHAFGNLTQYYNNIWSERRQLGALGLRVTDILANGKLARAPEFAIGFLEKFPMYIAQK